MILIDSLSYSSKLRYKNPEEKLAFAAASLLICVVSRSVMAALMILTVNSYLIVRRGRIPFLFYFRYLLVPLVFLTLSTFTILINVSKVPLNGYAIPIGAYYLTGSMEGLGRGGSLMITALSAVSCLYFLSMNTPVTEICEVLKRLHCPMIFIELMLLTYRFIFILAEVADAVLTAQKCRLGNRNLRTSADSFGKMISILFVRALKKSAHLYDAMEARCYDGELRMLREGTPCVRREVIGIVCYEMLLLGVAVWGF